jgi:hypothetical protein
MQFSLEMRNKAVTLYYGSRPYEIITHPYPSSFSYILTTDNMNGIQEHTYQLPQPVGEFNTISLVLNYNYVPPA